MVKLNMPKSFLKSKIENDAVLQEKAWQTAFSFLNMKIDNMRKPKTNPEKMINNHIEGNALAAARG